MECLGHCYRYNYISPALIQVYANIKIPYFSNLPFSVLDKNYLLLASE